MRKVSILLLMLITFGTSANANLSQQMDNLFGSMINVTPGQAYAGQRTGSLSAGSVVVRNKIKNATLLGFVAPHISAGCGGLDMFGGSFSFINAAEFEQLLRSIASNATGYFFELALQAMCPSCMGLMSDLQAKIQKLNGMMGNSCQIGQAVVNGAVSMIPEGTSLPIPGSDLAGVRDKAQRDFTATTTAFSDAYDSFFPKNNKNPVDTIKTAAPNQLTAKKLVGNVLWGRLKDSQADSWFVVGGDQLNREIIMSLLGTIETLTKASTDNTGAATTAFAQDTWPPTLTFKQFLEGDVNAKVYDCSLDLNECRSSADAPNPSTNKATKVVAIKGMQARVKAILFGNPADPTLPNNGSIGLINKYKTATGVTLTADEKNFINNSGTPVLAMVRTLTTSADPNSADLFGNAMVPVLAVDMVEQLIREYIETAKLAMIDTKENQRDVAIAFLNLLQKRKDDLNKEVIAFKAKSAGVSSAIALYSRLLGVLPTNLRTYSEPSPIKGAK